MSALATRNSLRRRMIPLTLAWSLAWCIGLASLVGLAVEFYAQKSIVELEAEMELYAMAIYGLAWFDDDGSFHDEWLVKEPLMIDPPFDLWVAEPHAKGVTYYVQPRAPRYDEPDFRALRRPVMEQVEEVWLDVESADGPRRLFATPAFAPGSDHQPVAVIAVGASYDDVHTAITRFSRRLWMAMALLGVLGLGIGAALSWWSLKPAVESLQQKEKFLAGAAHELRTPLAGLRSIVDGARSGTETAQRAIERIHPLLDQSANVVADLLLFARLDSGHESVRRERLRLDLLVEVCLSDDCFSQVELDLRPTEINADPRLAEPAIRNLLTNALQHGAGTGKPRVSSIANGIVVADHGPGFSSEVLEACRRGDFQFLPSSAGIGAGLALVQLIARLHGGRLRLDNPPEGGARAELQLGPPT